MKLGDVIWADLGESENGDTSIQKGRRPVLIFSNEKACSFSPCVNIIPITSSATKKKLPTHFQLKNLKKSTSFVLPEQIQTIDKKQLIGNAIYQLNSEELAMVSAAVKLQLGIN